MYVSGELMVFVFTSRCSKSFEWFLFFLSLKNPSSELQSNLVEQILYNSITVIHNKDRTNTMKRKCKDNDCYEETTPIGKGKKKCKIIIFLGKPQAV